MLALSGPAAGSQERRPWPAALVVTGNQVWMRFTSSPDVEYWGYKFTVRALSLHVNDAGTCGHMRAQS